MRRALSVLGLTAALVALLAPAGAAASNRQIAISNYRWSDPDIHIDKGEHVTWNWIGPDTMHSVTGISPNDLQWDSDPQTNQPQHRIGDNYRVTFDQPGVYYFQCKLHSTVRGEVTVSDTPGDPVSEPDPVPKSNVDLKPPNLRDLRLKKPRFARSGTVIYYALNERSKVDADIYRYDRHGHRKFQGWAKFKGNVGYNQRRFAARSKHFRPRSGRYVALIRATDQSNNETKPQKVRFTIR